MDYKPKDILAMGYEAGPHIPAMVAMANNEGVENLDSLAPVSTPKMELQPCPDFEVFATCENDDEVANINKVKQDLERIGQTPVVKGLAAMPDSCPTGGVPVGSVVVSEAIHPGWHSADLCCSLYLSVFEGVSPKDLLDAVDETTHFGPNVLDRKNQKICMGFDLREAIRNNQITAQFFNTGIDHFGTQGDGNHFAFVGTLKSTGQTALVTHHGSRGFGSKVYKHGMKLAEKFRQKLSPKTDKANAWIPFDTKEGQQYWEAIQIVREWTRQNHEAIHIISGNKAKATRVDSFWNEHNFVFRKDDGLFYHAKGATPTYPNWSDADTHGLSIIPMNMAEPILIVKGREVDGSFGFAPHGAGRNYSRTEHKRRGLGDFEAETKHIDARFFSGVPDATELPSAYKSADKMRKEIEHFGLAEIVDEVLPYGSIMGGVFNYNWKAK